MAEVTTKSEMKVVTGLVRFSYMHVWEPVRVNDSDDLKYSVALIISKTDKKTKADIDKALEAAKEWGKSEKWGGKIPGTLKTPWHDGDVERPDDPAYKDSWFINANAKTAPQIVDRNREDIHDKTLVYSGCYGLASITVYPYIAAKGGAKGIAIGLNNIMKVADGEPLSGKSSAKDDFANVTFTDKEDDLF